MKFPDFKGVLARGGSTVFWDGCVNEKSEKEG